MPLGNARPNTCRCFALRAGQSCGLTLALFLLASHASQASQTAVFGAGTRPVSTPGNALAFADLKKRGQDSAAAWSEDARARRLNKNQGLNKNIVLASDVHRTPGPNGRFHALSRAARVAPAASAKALRAALEREATRWREAARRASAAPSRNGNLYDDAGSLPAAPGEAKKSGDLSAVAADSDDGSREATGAVVAGGTDQVGSRPGVSLFYAEQPGGQEARPAAETSPAATADPAPAAAPMPRPPAATTIVFKRTGDQAYSTIVTAPPRVDGEVDTAPVTRAAPRPHPANDPWLNAVMLSPSIDRYLTTLVLGDPDYGALAPLVEKPASAVLMTFSAHPNAGLTTDRFSGSAVVFLPTVTYTRTAALR